MNRTIRLISVFLSVCLLLGAAFVVSAEEDCGIGDAAVLERDVNGATVVREVPGTLSQNLPEAALQSGKDISGEQTVEGFVYRMYKVVLGREPDPEGFASWVRDLYSGKRTAADIVSGFFNSNEYRTSKKTSSEIVADCYHAMMNRDPDAGGRADWMRRLNIGMTPNAVLYGFVGSQEFLALAAYYGIEPGKIVLQYNRDKNYEQTWFVYRLYDNCLGRVPDAQGLEDWCTALQNRSSGTTVASGFVFSAEYKKRHTDNGEYVDMLYQTILGRASDAAGRKSWKNLLDYSNTREHVLNGFMYSPEFREQCEKAGIVLGNPISEPDNTPAWKYNVRIMELANEDRAKEGAAPLILREDLWEEVAGVRARELPVLWSHTRPDGRDCFTAFDDAGMEVWTGGENIAYGYGSPESVYAAWMNSPGHHANLMNKDFEYIGSYYYKSNRPYWAQLFFTPLPW